MPSRLHRPLCVNSDRMEQFPGVAVVHHGRRDSGLVLLCWPGLTTTAERKLMLCLAHLKLTEHSEGEDRPWWSSWAELGKKTWFALYFLPLFFLLFYFSSRQTPEALFWFLTPSFWFLKADIYNSWKSPHVNEGPCTAGGWWLHQGPTDAWSVVMVRKMIDRKWRIQIRHRPK